MLRMTVWHGWRVVPETCDGILVDTGPDQSWGSVLQLARYGW